MMYIMRYLFRILSSMGVGESHFKLAGENNYFTIKSFLNFLNLLRVYKYYII